MPPEIPQRSKLNEMSVQAVRYLAREANLSTITYLNLFNNRIRKIENLEELSALQTLVLSFNEIKKIEGLFYCKSLKRLELNHNFISKIEGLDNLKALKLLDLSNNWISNIADIKHLEQHALPVSELSLRCNPISAKKSYRSHVFMTIHTLVRLDGVSIKYAAPPLTVPQREGQGEHQEGEELAHPHCALPVCEGLR